MKKDPGGSIASKTIFNGPVTIEICNGFLVICQELGTHIYSIQKNGFTWIGWSEVPLDAKAKHCYPKRRKGK